MVSANSEQFLFGILAKEAEDIRILHKLQSKNDFHILINYGCGQKYSRLRCSLHVKGLVICFYLGWSGSILQFRENIGGHGITPFFIPVFMNLAIFSIKRLQG